MEPSPDLNRLLALILLVHLELKAHRTTSRSRFWRIPPWESTPTAFSSTADPSAPSSITQTPGGRPPCPQLAAMRDQNPFASWPEHDLAWMLVNAYFERVNDIVPLLHRPTFESCVHPSPWEMHWLISTSSFWFWLADGTTRKRTTRTRALRACACSCLLSRARTSTTSASCSPRTTERRTASIRLAGS